MKQLEAQIKASHDRYILLRQRNQAELRWGWPLHATVVVQCRVAAVSTLAEWTSGGGLLWMGRLRSMGLV